MKLAWRDIAKFAEKPDPRALAVLIYGPDEGLVRERLIQLTKTVVEDPNDPFNIADLTADIVTDDPARLSDEARSISMLGGRRVVRLRGAGDSCANPCKSLLDAL